MRFKYSLPSSSSQESDSLPFLPLVLQYRGQAIQVAGLVDSGATVNVLPYPLGIQLGADWDESFPKIHLAGNLAYHEAIPLVLIGEVATYPPIRLVFAWSKSNDVPLILGQMNFFLEFEICFHRADLEFEVKPRN